MLLTYRRLVSILISNVSDGDRFAFGRGPGESTLGNDWNDRRVTAKVTWYALFLGSNTVAGFEAIIKQYRFCYIFRTLVNCVIYY